MYEHHKEPVLPRQQFLRRAARHGGVSVLIILLSLGIGAGEVARIRGWASDFGV